MVIDDYRAASQHLETIIDFLRFGITQSCSNHVYYGHGTDNPWDEMIALIFGSLHLPLDVDPLIFQARLTQSEKEMLLEQFSRRFVQKIPVPYLTNTAYFCGLSFYVDERVLIPRSPIAEWIKRQFSPWIIATDVERILDLCTGSGCLAIACAYAFPDATVDAVDISKKALEVATINCQRHDLDGIINLIESDCWKKVPPVQYNIILSNPPYVSAEEMKTLPDEYHHEPQLALHADKNGLAIVEKILNNAHDYLTEDGILIVEVGNNAHALEEAFPEVPFTWLEFEHGGEGVFLMTSQQLQTYFSSPKRGVQ